MSSSLKSSSNKKKRNEIAKIIKDRFESSSVIAFSSFIRNENWIIKITWLIFLLGTASVCGWFISRSINDYLNYNVITKTIIKNVNKIKFPIVSICNINPFTTDYSTTKILNLTGLKESPFYSAGYEILAKISLHSGNNSINRTLLGKRLNETIINCIFLTKKCDLYSDFEPYYDINHGNCFRFNSGKTMNGTSAPFKYVFNSGQLSALYLDLFMGAAYNNENFFSIENGFSIFINDEIKDSTTTQGIRISPGTSTLIVLDKYSTKKQPKPYSDCISDLTTNDSYSSTCYKRVFSPDRTYRFTDCSFMCFQKFLGDTCGCQTSYLNYFYYTDMRICSKQQKNLDDFNCLLTQWIKFSDTQRILEQCDCPLECENIGYNFKISFAEYPTLIYFKSHLKNNSLITSRFSYNTSEITYENVRRSTGRLTILFDEMKQTFINEEVKTEVFDLVSSVGGFLGLFLGISCLSLVEIIEIFLKISILFYDLTIRSNRSSKVSNIDRKDFSEKDTN